MLNIHLYRSNFKNESRIYREVMAIEELNLFDQIHLIGINDKGLPSKEKFSKFTTIYRFLNRSKRKSQLATLISIFNWHLRISFKYINKEIKCINCHSINVLPLAVFLKLLTNSKLIYDAHELETETAALRGFSKLIAKIIENIFINSADYCIFVSDSIQKWYLEKYGIKKSFCIYNCPTYKKSKKSNYLRSKFNIPIDSNIFIYQGAFVEERGLEILLKVFSNNIKYNIVFMGFGKLENLIKSYADKYPNIYFHTSVKPSQVLKITKSADVGIALVDGKYLNHQYCLPNKLFEYILADLPVLVSDTFELRNFVRKNKVGISCKFNEQNINKSIKEISQKKNRYSNFLEKVKIKYDFKVQKDKYKIMFNQLGF